MFLVARAITYSSLFIGFLLVFLPARILARTGVTRPTAIGLLQATGLALAFGGALLALWCIGTFAFVGRGTPAPFDPPRQLVVRGPYRLLRNPMYLGALMVLSGAALFYQSWALLGYAAAFGVTTHLFVLGYEEPTLRRVFGAQYAEYCATVHRWLPGWH